MSRKRLTALAAALVALTLAGCAGGDDGANLVLRPGLFAVGEAPAFAPPAKGELTTAQAAALAFYDSGVRLLPAAPAPGVLAVGEPFAALGKCAVRQHDDPRMVLALAAGDAFFGRRSAAVITIDQCAGLTGALNQLARWRLRAGMVVVVLCDRDVRYSTSRMDAEALFAATSLPNRVSDPGEVYREIQDGFATSEQMGLPYLLRVETDELARPARYARFEMPSPRVDGSADVLRDVLSPAVAVYQDALFTAKRVNSGASSVRAPELPRVPDSLPPGFRARFALYEPAMSVLRDLGPDAVWVASEGQALGLFAYPPYHTVDAAGFDGSALPLAARAWRSGRRPALAVMNEHDFLRWGEAGLRTAAAEGAPVKLLVLNTGLPETAGAEAADQERLAAVLARSPVKAERVSFNLGRGEFAGKLKAMLDSPDAAAIVVDYK